MREITVYNTMTRQKEVFNPVTPGEAKNVRMWCYTI